MTSPFLKKLDNYWYHYKWHTVIALFLVVTILICSLQMCAKDEYDIEIIYAGPKSLNDAQTILDIEAAFTGLGSDRTGDGQASVNLVCYWIDETISPDSENYGNLSASDISYSYNYSMTNRDSYLDEIAAGDVSIYLVSPYLFHLVDDEAGFMRVTDIYPALADFEKDVCVYDGDGKINRFGVVLSKTALGQRAGLSSLPEDTILCIRKLPAMRGWFGAKTAEELHAYSTELFRASLALGKKQQ